MSGYKRIIPALAMCLLWSFATSAGAFQKTTEQGKTVFHLRLAETWPPGFPSFGDAVDSMVAMSERMSTTGFLPRTIHFNFSRRSRSYLMDLEFYPVSFIRLFAAGPRLLGCLACP